jgi:hypothetical protein
VTTDRINPRPGDIRLDPISATEWRVCDRTLDDDEAMSILGFIELRNGQFEVTRMSAPADRKRFASLNAARDAFTSAAGARIHMGNYVV